jgi:hypothetical protein
MTIDNSQTASPSHDLFPPSSSLPPSIPPSISPLPDPQSSSPISTASDPYDLDDPKYRSISDLYSEPPSPNTVSHSLPESNQFSSRE